MTQARAEFAKLEAQVAAFNESMKKSVLIQDEFGNPKNFTTNVKGLREARSALKTYSATYRDAAASTGMFEVSQLRVNSATEEYTKALDKQKVSFGQWRKQQALARAAYREQLALQQMIVKQMPGTTAGGKGIYDVAVPTEVNESLNTFSKRLGWAGIQLKSFSTQMVNWGKNTQWAGRQLMVGFTVPVIAFGAAAGAAAYKVNEAMTRITKVYNTTANQTSGNMAQMAAAQQELDQVRTASMDTAIKSAKAYGSSINDTLDVTAQMAAVGYKGAQLQQMTNEVMRASTLGEIDNQTAMKSTIAMMTVFHHSVKQMGDDWNYMNSVENATSLEMKDFAAAIPIAAKPVEMMGGTIKDLGTMLVAMKAGGIDATQGANAIKSALQRLLNPSKEALDLFQQITHVDFTELQKQTKGNLLEMLKGIGAATEHLTALQRGQVLGKLFGTYQVTRLTTLMDGLNGIGKGATQVASAMKIAGQSTEQWSKTAQYELGQIQKSASGQFRIALQTLKAELASVGEPFLKAGTDILHVIVSLMDKFNKLPDAVKKGFAWGSILMAAVGPLVMLLGLSANFAGNIMSVFGSMMKFLGSMELVNKESAVSRIAMQLQKAGFVSTGTAVEQLRKQLEMLALAEQEAARAAGTLPGYFEGAFGSGAYKGPQRPRSAGGQFTRGRPYMMQTSGGKVLAGMNSPYNPRGLQYTPAAPEVLPLNGIVGPSSSREQMAYVAKDATKTAEETDKARTSMKGVGMYAGVAAASMGAMMLSSNKTVDHVAQIALGAATIAPLLVGAAKALNEVKWAEIGTTLASKWSVAAEGVSSAFTAIRSKATLIASGSMTMSEGLGEGLVALGGMLGPAGILAATLAAVGGAAYLLYKNFHAAGDEVKSMLNDGHQLSNILGYQYHDPTSLQAPTGGAAATATQHNEQLSQMQENYGALIDKIHEAIKAGDELKAMNNAQDIGLQVINTGGTVEDAKKAVRLALEAASNESKAHQIMIHFAPAFNYNDMKNVMHQAAQRSSAYFHEALSNINNKGFVESVLGHTSSMSDRSRQYIDAMGQKIGQMYNASVKAGMGPGPVEEMLRNQLNQIDSQINAASKKNDLQTVQRLEDARKELINVTATGIGAKDTLKDMSNEWYANANAAQVFAQTWMNLGNEHQRYNFLHQLYMDGKATNAQIQEMTALGLKLFSQNTDAVNKEADAQKNLTKATDATTAAQSRLNAEVKAYKAVDWKSAYQDAMSTTEQQLGDIASQNFDNRMNTAMQHYTAQQNKRLTALKWQQKKEMDDFTSRWRDRTQKVNAYYDQRVKNIKGEMAAEQKAEQQREAIFNAEQQRMQRMADMANQNIDFNTALNSGNLDEAAKVMNDMTAKESEWALGQAQDAAKKASQARQAELQHQEDALNKAKQQRLNHLQDIEKAEKRALERRQQSEQAALKKEVDMNVAAQQEIWNNRKTKLDQAIQYFEDYIPKNEADLRRHINDVSHAYSDFNVSTQGQFNKTAVNIGKMLNANVRDAGQKIRSDVQWAGVGKDVAQKMIQGAFGMNLNQFKHWLMTGKWPGSGGGHHGPLPSHPHNKAGVRTDNSSAPSQFSGDPTYYAYEQKLVQQMNTYHTGGIAGVDPGGRAGIPKGHPDEVPAVLLKGEGVLNRKAMANIGPAGFRALNNGVGNDGGYGTGGYSGGPLGFAGLMGALMFRAVAQTIDNGIITGATARMAGKAAPGAYQFTPGKPLRGLGVDRSQMQNATIIANVGSQMGMSKRDIEIAIMTALTESHLSNLNYGDRDSLGLFQQRPSQGWGTPAQIENPRYAAHKFYEVLKGVTDRGNMAPWLAAQAVQRSAYADGSNYRQYWNEALAIYSGLGRGRPTIGGDRGWHRPVAGKYGLTQGLHDQYTGFPAVDFGVPVGTPVVSVAPGRIAKSYDLRGYEPRNYVQNGYRSYGRIVQISHPGGFQSLYAHLSAREATVGQRVMGGQEIGRSGNTGYSSGPHLHFGTQGISPYKFVSLSKGAQDIRWDNTVANLHHGEAVLTKDLNDDFKRGVRNFADGGKTEYNLHMHVNESVNVDELVGKTMTAIRRLEMRKPQSRRNS